MNAHEILDHIKAENVRIVLLKNDKIDVSGDKVKVAKLLPFIREHKTEIINFLSGEVVAPINQHEPISCFSCSNFDGKGSSWPGMCLYFETIGQQAKEINFDMVNPTHGCKFYTARMITTELLHRISFQITNGDVVLN